MRNIVIVNNIENDGNITMTDIKQDINTNQANVNKVINNSNFLNKS